MGEEIEVELSTVLRRNDDFLESDLGSEKVLLHVDKGNYFGMNEVGSRILDRCDGRTPLSEVCRELEEAYEVSPEDCRQQVLAYARRLLKSGLAEKANC